MTKNEKILLFGIVLFTLTTLTFEILWVNRLQEDKWLITACEKELPRHQHCIIEKTAIIFKEEK